MNSLSESNTFPVSAARKAADKRRLNSQRIFDSMPAMIDAIKAQRESATAQLRVFMMEREKTMGDSAPKVG